MFKRAVIFSLLFVTVLVVALFYILDSMAVRDIAKRFIITKANYQMGLKVNVGDVRLSYFNPAVIVSGLEFEKQDEDINIKLKVDQAVVRFDLFKLIRGNVSLSGFKLVAPDATVEINRIKGTDGNSFNYSSILAMLSKFNINRADIIDGKFHVKLKRNDGRYDEYVLPSTNLKLRRGIISDYKLQLKLTDMTTPLRYIQNISFNAVLKKDSIMFEKMEVGVPGGKALLDGTVYGVSDLDKMKPQLKWSMDFNLDNMRDYDGVLKDKDLYTMKGTVSGKGKISGRLSKDLKGLLVDAHIAINDFKWRKYNLPKVDVRGKYDNDRVFILRLDVSDGQKSINLYDTSVSMKPPYNINGKGSVNYIELSRYLELFSLNNCLSRFIIGGPFTFSGAAQPEFKISALFDLKVSDFWVLYKKGLPLQKQNSVLEFKNGKAVGRVNFSAKGAYFDNFLAKSENNDIHVDGWIKEDATVDISVRSDSFSLDTYGRIGVLPVSGQGSFNSRLTVDQNANFKSDGKISFADTQLLNKYIFGTVNSRILYDDNTGILSFKSASGKIGTSHYGGYIDIKLRDKFVTINGRGELRNAYSEDVYQLFKIKDKIVGTSSAMISGWVKFAGIPNWNSIRLDSKLKFKDVEFFSERFDEMVADFTWNKGDVSVNELYILKGKGRFDFKGLRKDKVFKLGVSSKNINIADIAAVSGESIDVTGKVDVKGEADYYKENINGSMKFNLFDLMLAEQKLKPVLLSLDFGKQIAVKFSIFDKEAVGELKRESADLYSLSAKLSKFDIYPLVGVFIKELEPFNTEIDGELELKFSLDSGINHIKVDADNFILRSGVISLKNNGKISVEYANGNYIVRSFSMVNESENNKCVVDVSSGASGSILVKGCAGTGGFKLFKGFISGARGHFDLDLVYDGKLRGTIIPRDFEIMTAEQKLGILGLNGRIDVSNSIADLNNLNATASGGVVNFWGTIDLDKLIKLKSFYPPTRLRMNVDKVYFEYPEDLKGKWSGNLKINGDGIPYIVTGDLALFDATYRRDFDFTNFNFSDTGQVSNVLSVKRSKDKFNFDIKTKSGTDIFIKNNIFNGDLTFNLNVKGTENRPRLVGSIDLLRGKVTYLDNNFDLTSGRIKFKDDETEPIIYQLDSESKIGTYQVYLNLVSYKGEPKFRLNTVPPLTEDKILALLTTGDVQTDFGAKEGGYGITTGTGGQIVTQGMGVTGALRSSTGVGVKLRPPKNKDSSAPDVEVQKDITSDLKVTYGKSLNDNTSANRQEVNVQYDVNRNVQLKLLLEEDKKENVNKDPTNAGVDVKFRFEF
ncbi:MAG: translocation/assembly module TamB domain-containing protein [Pseudomonadota bacterium]